jgi:hypothetical protein
MYQTNKSGKYSSQEKMKSKSGTDGIFELYWMKYARSRRGTLALDS